MNIKLMSITKIYNFEVEENYSVQVKVYENKMDIIKAEMFYVDENELEWNIYTNLKYTRRVVDMSNLENEMKIFIKDRIDKIFLQIDKAYNKVRGLKQ